MPIRSARRAKALKALKLSPATVNKKAKKDQTLSPGGSERVIGFARLVGQLQVVTQDSGNPEGFDAIAWMSRWLNHLIPALGGARPIDLMDTMEGPGPRVQDARTASERGVRLSHTVWRIATNTPTYEADEPARGRRETDRRPLERSGNS